MGKNRDNKFQNFSAKRLKDIDHVATMCEEEIYDILRKDIKEILNQVADYQETQDSGSYHERKKKSNHKGFSPYPNYTKNIFANLSGVKFFYELVYMWKEGDVELDKRERGAIKMLLSTAYRDTISKTKVYPVLDDEYRCEMICEAFKILDKKHYKLALKLTSYETVKSSRLKRPDSDKSRDELRKEKEIKKAKAEAAACELTIQAFQDPKYTARVVVREFDRRTMSSKKKMKLLHKLYGKRFHSACGAILGIEGGSSDIVGDVKDAIAKMKKKERIEVLRAYGDYFKRFGKRSFLLDSRFYKKHKKIIKKLIREDIGYKKAFAGMKDKKPSEDKEKTGKKSFSGERFHTKEPASSMKAEDRVAELLAKSK